EALRAAHPNDVTAVTVDRGLRCQATSGGDLIGDRHAWTPLALPLCADAPVVLLEVKVGADVAPWSAALIDELAPWRVSFSKYVAAMTDGRVVPPCAAEERLLDGQLPAV